VCDCQGSAAGLFCRGADATTAFSLVAYLPQTTIAEACELGHIIWRGHERAIGSGGENIFYQAEHEWPQTLQSEHFATGQGSLWRTEALEVIAWCARARPRLI
jgi:hypothetical protein